MHVSVINQFAFYVLLIFKAVVAISGVCDGEMCNEEMMYAQENGSLHKECKTESTNEEDGILEEVMAFADFYPTEDNQKLHHEMLQDKARNVAYRTAIIQNQQHIQDKVVLDVGCGTGILSMMSVKHGKASKVFAVEASGFAKHTQMLTEANGMSDKIQVFDGKIESVQLPHKVDLIISEWMGTFLLFEWMIESVIVARDRWLKDDGVVWPSHAGLYLVPCCAEELYKNKVSFWESVEDFDFSSLV